MSEVKRKVPVTIVTGALGSGKTTLLKHLLHNQPAGKKICVVQNEVSEFVVEDALYVGSAEKEFEKYVELPNGCVCCSVRDEFVQALETLCQRDSSFDHIVVETSGLADPGAVVSLLWVDEALEGVLFLDAVVAVVDACFLKESFRAFGEKTDTILRQIGCADLVLVNKVDLVSAEQQGGNETTLEQVLAQVKDINTLGEILCTTRCDIEVGTVLDRQAFDAKAITQSLSLPPSTSSAPHSHDESMKAVAFELNAADTGLVDMRKMCLWLDGILYERTVPGGGEVFRLKALTAVHDCPNRVVFQGVHTIYDHEEGMMWAEGEPKVHRIVLIGRDLKVEVLRTSFIEHVVTRPRDTKE